MAASGLGTGVVACVAVAVGVKRRCLARRRVERLDFGVCVQGEAWRRMWCAVVVLWLVFRGVGWREMGAAWWCCVAGCRRSMHAGLLLLCVLMGVLSHVWCTHARACRGCGVSALDRQEDEASSALRAAVTRACGWVVECVCVCLSLSLPGLLLMSPRRCNRHERVVYWRSCQLSISGTSSHEH